MKSNTDIVRLDNSMASLGDVRRSVKGGDGDTSMASLGDYMKGAKGDTSMASIGDVNRMAESA